MKLKQKHIDYGKNNKKKENAKDNEGEVLKKNKKRA